MTGASATARSLRFDRIEVRPQERRVLVDRAPASLGARAFDILIALIERRDRLVTKAELLDIVWPDTIVEENNLQVHISALRRLLGSSAIATIPGRGYRFALTPDDEVAGAASTGAANVDAPAPTPSSLTNVPAAIDALIGRAIDVDAVSSLLAAHRLVTILGPGGIGKTRVALDVARAQSERHPQGTWWVDFAAITTADRLAPAIANAASLQLGERDARAALSRALAHSDTLLVLDNCEHLVADIAPLVQAVLEASSRVSVLTTSQVPLKLAAEHVYRLDTLETPPIDADLASARQYAALQLLERRAHAADRRFTLAEGNLKAAIEVCRALDGVALAVEMAATRIPWMGAGAVRDHLSDRLRMLVSANRIADGRHQTLRATLDWSHALLSAEERTALRRLATFVGSFTLACAQHVAAGDDLDEWAVLDALAGLVDKSLLRVEQLDPPRYRLLETTRFYALERLEAAGELSPMHMRHGSAIAELARRAMADSWVLTDADWSARYASDYADLEAAFARAAERDDAAVVADTCEVLRAMDSRRGVVSGLRPRMQAAHRLVSTAQGRIAARLWDSVSPSDQIAIASIPRLDAAKQRLAAWRALDDSQSLYRALLTMADEHARAGDFAAAHAALAEAAAIERPAWPGRLRMTLAAQRGSIAMYAKDAEGYRRWRRQMLALAEQAGARRSMISAKLGLGDAALLAQDYDEAATLCRAVADELRSMNNPFTLGIALENLANALVHLGDLNGAYRAALESLPLMRDNEAGADLFNILALIAARSGRFAEAARMLGHVDAWVERSQYALAPNEARAATEAGTLIDAAIGAEAHERLRKDGARMPDAELDALAAQLRDEAAL